MSTHPFRKGTRPRVAHPYERCKFVTTIRGDGPGETVQCCRKRSPMSDYCWQHQGGNPSKSKGGAS